MFKNETDLTGDAFDAHQLEVDAIRRVRRKEKTLKSCGFDPILRKKDHVALALVLAVWTV